MNAENIGKYLKNLRIKHNYTQEELANKLHITRQAISSWENGRFIPDIEKIYDLANLYDVTIEEIYACGKLKSNSKSNEIFIDKIHTQKKKYLITILMIVIAFIFIFFVYYFLNSYKKTRIYTIGTENSPYKINGDILKINKTIYFNLMINKENLKEVCLYYGDDKILCTDNSNVLTFKEKLGYGEYILDNNFHNFINNLFIEINSTKIKLSISKYFVNDNLVFDNSKNVADTSKDELKHSSSEIPAYIKKNYNYNDETEIYSKDEKIKGNIYIVKYNCNNEIISITYEKDNIFKVWHYSLETNNFIDYMEYDDIKKLHSLNETEIKKLDNQTFNKYFKDILDFINKIKNN